MIFFSEKKGWELGNVIFFSKKLDYKKKADFVL